MTLWPEEHEGLGDEARATATRCGWPAIAEMFGASAPATVPADRDERVREPIDAFFERVLG